MEEKIKELEKEILHRENRIDAINKKLAYMKGLNTEEFDEREYNIFQALCDTAHKFSDTYQRAKAMNKILYGEKSK